MVYPVTHGHQWWFGALCLALNVILVRRPLRVKYPFPSAVELGSFYHCISLKGRGSQNGDYPWKRTFITSCLIRISLQSLYFAFPLKSALSMNLNWRMPHIRIIGSPGSYQKMVGWSKSTMVATSKNNSVSQTSI